MGTNSDFQDINQEKENINSIETEWLENLDDLKSSKSENIKMDLFSAIEYLISCELFFKNSSNELKKINEKLQRLSELKNQQKANQFNELINQIESLKMNLEKNLENLDNEYSILSEETLTKAQDIIAQFNETKSNFLTLKGEINQKLDRKLYLQELKDSLEKYRDSREESISENIMDEIRKLPNHIIPEDLGKEVPQLDPILSQLDTAITECDFALLISESTETE